MKVELIKELEINFTSRLGSGFNKEYLSQYNYDDPNAMFTQEQINRIEQEQIKMENNNGLRMYAFVMGNLSGRQQGIQMGHACLEYVEQHGKSPQYRDFIKNHKTFIMLDGGGSNEMISRELELEGFGVPFASFEEPDLNNSVSAIAFLMPEDIYNFDEQKYIMDTPHRINLLLTMPTKEERVEVASREQKYEIYKWLKSFRLASN